MALVGYARVSSVGQSLEVQLDKLDRHPCDKIFQEKRSGTTAARPALQECLSYIREGDTLVVTRLDRLARSIFHLCEIASILEQKRVDLHAIDQQLDTTTATGRLLFHMLGAIAQFETELRAERQAEGVEKAKARGVRFGVKKKLSSGQVAELQSLRESGSTIVDLTKTFGLSKRTVYRYLQAGSEKREEKQR